MHFYYFAGLLTTIFLSSKASLLGRCSECLPTGIACLDERTFAVCYRGKIDNKLVKCPEGSYCTDHKTICSTKLDGRLPVCRYRDCGNCLPFQGRGHFICVNETSFGFCLGGPIPEKNTIHQCPNGFVCNSRTEQICSPRNITMPSCIAGLDDELNNDQAEKTPTTAPPAEVTISSTTTLTFTPTISVGNDSTTLKNAGVGNNSHNTTTDHFSGITNPTTQSTTTNSQTTNKITVEAELFCNNKKEIGNFKDDADKSCKHYFFCFFLSGQYLGYRLECRNYFDSKTSRCQDYKPKDCEIE